MNDKTQVPDIQVSTQQVPIGPHSIFDPPEELTEFERACYLVLNENSNWDTGITHALSYTRLANLLNVKHRSQVIRAIRSLINKGWVSVETQRKIDKANVYKLTHHKCEPEDVPLDADNRPQKCAVPRGEGSASRLVAEGKLDWRPMVQWFVQKVNSDWITGIVKMTVREAGNLLNFSFQTICDNVQKLVDCSLLERLSKKTQASVFQLYPKPYPDRRKRAEYMWDHKPLPLIKDWYYSYNKRWRFHRETLILQMEDEAGMWRDTSMPVLMSINMKIYRDFREYMDQLTQIQFSKLCYK